MSSNVGEMIILFCASFLVFIGMVVGMSSNRTLVFDLIPKDYKMQANLVITIMSQVASLITLGVIAVNVHTLIITPIVYVVMVVPTILFANERGIKSGYVPIKDDQKGSSLASGLGESPSPVETSAPDRIVESLDKDPASAYGVSASQSDFQSTLTTGLLAEAHNKTVADELEKKDAAQFTDDPSYLPPSEPMFAPNAAGVAPEATNQVLDPAPKSDEKTTDPNQPDAYGSLNEPQNESVQMSQSMAEAVQAGTMFASHAGDSGMKKTFSALKFILTHRVTLIAVLMEMLNAIACSYFISNLAVFLTQGLYRSTDQSVPEDVRKERLRAGTRIASFVKMSTYLTSLLTSAAAMVVLTFVGARKVLFASHLLSTASLFVVALVPNLDKSDIWLVFVVAIVISMHTALYQSVPAVILAQSVVPQDLGLFLGANGIFSVLSQIAAAVIPLMINAIVPTFSHGKFYMQWNFLIQACVCACVSVLVLFFPPLRLIKKS